MPDDVFDFHAALRRQLADQRAAAVAFARAITAGSSEDIRRTSASLGEHGSWPMALGMVARGLGGGPRQREAFLQIWIDFGCQIRTEAGSDLILADALRKMLPRYEGPAMTLYRGDGWWNRCRRTYGLSWARDRSIADDFAKSRREDYTDGSCLLRTIASPSAIICQVPSAHDRFEEGELIVDRRNLGGVEVVARYRREVGPDDK